MAEEYPTTLEMIEVFTRSLRREVDDMRDDRAIVSIDLLRMYLNDLEGQLNLEVEE